MNSYKFGFAKWVFKEMPCLDLQLSGYRLTGGDESWAVDFGWRKSISHPASKIPKKNPSIIKFAYGRVL